MSRKTKAVPSIVLMCVCAVPALTQAATNETQKPAVAPAGPIVNKEAGEKMTFETLTPNLIVNDIDRSATFYRDVLGFQQVATVPEEPPFVFVWLKQGKVDVFLNVPQPDKADSPISLSKSIAGTNTMYVKLNGIDDLAARVREHGVTPAIAMHKEFYGMREFGVLDPDGYLIVFAEPTE